MLVVCSFLLVVNGLLNVECSLLVIPNQLVDIGSDVAFNCCCTSSDSTYVRWDYIANDTSEYVTVYNGNMMNPSFDGRFSVDTETSQCTLTIRSVQWSDAGQYRCLECVENDEKSSCSGVNVQLVVVDNSTHLQCQTNVTSVNNAVNESDYIEVVCSVNYHGIWSPSTRCSITTMKGSESKSCQLTAVSPSVSKETNITTVTTKRIIQATATLDGSHLVCTTTFKGTFVTEYTEDVSIKANNFPQCTWNSNIINVIYATRNLTINTEAIVRQGDKLTCSAQGNPTPVIKWFDWANNSTTTGDNYRIDVCIVSQILSGELVNVNLTCHAENSIDGKLHQISKNKVFTVKCENLSQQVIIWLSFVTGIVFLFFVIGLIAVIYSRKRRNKCRVPGKPDIVPYAECNGYVNLPVVELQVSTARNHADVDVHDEYRPESDFSNQHHVPADGVVNGESKYAELAETVHSAGEVHPRSAAATASQLDPHAVYASIKHQPSAPSQQRRRKLKR